MTTSPMADRSIQQDVLNELDADPRLATADVGMEVDEGVVTLTGTVDTYAKQHAAERAALRVAAVRAVANDIAVLPAGWGHRTDTELAKAAAEALRWNVLAPTDAIDITVAQGVVTLRGAVTWNDQRVAAVTAMRNVVGVREVVNQLTLTQPMVSSTDIHARIAHALARHPTLDADNVQLQIADGHVTLTGEVRSWTERQDAETAAWTASGVTAVTNTLWLRLV